LLSGLWHGAKWTFVFWGMYHAILFIVTKLVNKNKEFNGKKIIISISRGLKILITFFLVVFGFVIFRANSLVDSYYFIKKIFSISLFSRPYIGGMARVIVFSLFSIVVLIVVEWINRHEEYGLKILPQKKLGRWAIYIIVTILIIEMGGNQQEFIYFQF
jgi:D-alanyl-lipoteichoic acid acyltransferase DltB (MBOAT superfamily)